MEAKEKLKKIGLDFKKVPDIFKLDKKISYKPLKEYDNTNYKVYHFIDIDKIEIYLTKTTRLEDTEKKYKLAEPLLSYIDPENDEFKENHNIFLDLLEKLDLEKLEQIEEEQKEFEKHIPFEVKYKENFIWEIYYSEIEDKYFMMFPTEESQVESLFYLIKKQIEIKKSHNVEKIYVPVNNIDYSNYLLKKSEIADLENYLWYFTKSFPSTYEIKNDNKRELQIVGNLFVYDTIKSIYKIKLTTKEEAIEQFKLIKALFIISSNMEEQYSFRLGINENGAINFYFNNHQITYENLADFIKIEIENKYEELQETLKKLLEENEKWITLKETVQNQTIEYVAKEKQISTFLECKRTFFGKVSYFFKVKKKKVENKEIKKETKEEKEEKKFELEEKEFYTIEDLIKLGTTLEEKEKELKDKQMDIKVLEVKKENLQNKIKNANKYLDEIESHRKSIFDFWKFTKQGEVSYLTEGRKKEEENQNKIKKSFVFDEDIEEVGKDIDKKQRNIFSNKECDAIFAIYQDVEAFNKKEDNYFKKSLEQKKEEYKLNFENIKENDFDVFGGMLEDSTKIKVLNNQKHREIEKDKFRILDIHLNTTLEEYKDNIKHYKKILENCYLKMTSPYDIPLYYLSNDKLENENLLILDMNAQKEIENIKEDNLKLNRINLKENMNAIFYSNIMFYGNLNNTLPEGMNVSTKVLLDLEKYELKLIEENSFNINFLKNQFENKVNKVNVYEYDIKRKEMK